MHKRGGGIRVVLLQGFVVLEEGLVLLARSGVVLLILGRMVSHHHVIHLPSMQLVVSLVHIGFNLASHIVFNLPGLGSNGVSDLDLLKSESEVPLEHHILILVLGEVVWGQQFLRPIGHI